MPVRIAKKNWRVVAICEHITTKQSLPGGGIAVRIHKPSCGGVIIAGLEVIEAAFGIIVVATVTKRVLFSQGAGGCEELAVGVVGITRHGIAAGIHQAHDIALQICDVIIGRAIDLHSVGLAGRIVEEVVGFRLAVGRYLLLQQLPAGVNVAVSGGGFRIDDLVACEDTSKLCTIGR